MLSDLFTKDSMWLYEKFVNIILSVTKDTGEQMDRGWAQTDMQTQMATIDLFYHIVKTNALQNAL